MARVNIYLPDELAKRARAVVELLLFEQSSGWLAAELDDHELAAPGHFHSEVLNAIGKSFRRGLIAAREAELAVMSASQLPIRMEHLAGLVQGAWARRDQHALPDALYVELAAQLDTVVITTDRRLARATPLAVAPPG